MNKLKVRYFVDGKKIDGLNVHVQPSTHAKVIDAFRPGRVVDVTERRYCGWAEVWCSTPKSEHALGWVREKFLEVVPEKKCEPLKAPPVLMPVSEDLFRPGAMDVAVVLAVALPLLFAALLWALHSAL